MSQPSKRATIVVIVVVTAVAGLFIIGIDELLHERIALAQGEVLRQTLREIPMPPYDNDPVRDMLEVSPTTPAAINPQRVFRVRQHGVPVGVYISVASSGYGGG